MHEKEFRIPAVTSCPSTASDESWYYNLPLCAAVRDLKVICCAQCELRAERRGRGRDSSWIRRGARARPFRVRDMSDVVVI
ncbi:hypothetical protein NDU88_001037 [Pleurodeles waltl]|uniref:Uncharacterized protein n=1 Tax=Pleurodeles waltl TaxID=8319 RepID=A0AAV7TGH2_PLEWA|nr:hypothetical protein NDU88_001037 [Pleurodeles waltl]